MSEMYDRQQFFSTYFSKASEKPLFLKRFAEKFVQQSGRSCHFLDLGSHDGALILRLMDLLKPRLSPEVKVTAVDPSKPAIDDFRKKALPKDIQFDFSVDTAESFLSKTEDRYEWIIASHCLYWSPNLEEIISLIVERGENSVIVLRGNRGIYEIQSRFRHLLGNTSERLYTADDVEKCLLKRGYHFTREEHQTRIDIPNFDSQEFKWLVSFFLQTIDEKISENEWQSLTSYFSGRNGTVEHDVNFFWIKGRQ